MRNNDRPWCLDVAVRPTTQPPTAQFALLRLFGYAGEPSSPLAVGPARLPLRPKARTMTPSQTAAWLRIGVDAWALGWKAAEVIGKRGARIAAGGPDAGTEAWLMLSEKWQAAVELQSRPAGPRAGRHPGHRHPARPRPLPAKGRRQ